MWNLFRVDVCLGIFKSSLFAYVFNWLWVFNVRFNKRCCIVVGYRFIVQTLVFSRSYLHRQVSSPETLVVKGGTTWARNGRWILPENARLPRNVHGSFIYRKSTTWDKRLYSPSKGRGAEDFFSPWKIRRFRPGLNLRTWIPKASTLPLDHRSRFNKR